MIENAVDDRWLGDERDYAHLFTAAGTGERIDLEDASQQLGPTVPCLTHRLGLGVEDDERVLLVRLGGLTATTSFYTYASTRPGSPIPDNVSYATNLASINAFLAWVNAFLAWVNTFLARTNAFLAWGNAFQLSAPGPKPHSRRTRTGS